MSESKEATNAPAPISVDGLSGKAWYVVRAQLIAWEAKGLSIEDRLKNLKEKHCERYVERHC